MDLSQKIRREIFDKYEGKCSYCGKEILFKDDARLNGKTYIDYNSYIEYLKVVMNIDHIKPSSKGGSNNIENLNPCCRACNSGKKNMSLEDFRINITLTQNSIPFKRRQYYYLIDNYGFDLLSNIDKHKFYYEVI